MNPATDADITALAGLGLEALRAEWRTRFGAPPTLRSPEILTYILAWRIQAERHGGLDAETRRGLRRPAPGRTAPAPTAGTRLVREWQGSAHEVIIMGDGAFLYRGERHKSLSQIARLITGVRWNGPRFFGLRQSVGGA